MFNVTKELDRRVPLAKLVHLNRDICLYLVSLMVVALSQAKEALVVPDNLELHRSLHNHFNSLFAKNSV